MSFLDDLDRGLRSRRVPARTRRRIVLELEDHLACDPDSVRRLGSPHELARLFAEELATSESRRAALAAFVALIPAGVGFAVCWLSAQVAGGWPDVFAAETVPLGLLAALSLALAPQVAFAAGLLALLGALRTRAERIVPAAEAALLLRRTTVALAAGGASLAALALYAAEYRAGVASWWVAMTVAMAGTFTVPLVLAGARARRAAAIRTAAPGEAGDVFDDLPLRLPRHAWGLCAVVALLAASAAAIAGGGEEGLRNAVGEGLAVVGGFALLGRLLGLRR